MSEFLRDTEKKKLDTDLQEVQKKSLHRLLTVSEVLGALEEAERRLRGLEIPKKYWEGTTVIVEENFSLPNAYRHVPNSTTVTLMRGRNQWRVVHVYRGPSGRKGGTKMAVGDVGTQWLSKHLRELRWL